MIHIRSHSHPSLLHNNTQFYHNTETNETCWDHPGEEVMK